MQLDDDIIDLRDILERFEELEEELESNDEEKDDSDVEELQMLQQILDELKGCGGDEKWRGDWYPNHLIKESYFTEYCEQQLVDCGYIPADLPSWIVIDFQATADNMNMDYSSIDIEDNTYYYR